MSEKINYCLKCFKTESHCKCEQKKSIILLDTNMVDIITILNKKGYETKFCCESHPYQYMPSLYILFQNDMSCLKDSIPESFHIDTDNKRLIKICKSIKAKKEGLKDLLEWSIKLPDISKLKRRVDKMQNTCIQIRIDKETKKRIEGFIRERPVTLSELVRILLIEEIENPKLDYSKFDPCRKTSIVKKTTLAVVLPDVMIDILRELAKRKRASISIYTAIVLGEMLEEDEVWNTSLAVPLPEGKKSVVQIRIPENIKNSYTTIASERGSSCSSLVAHVILKYLKGIGYTF